MGQYISFFFLSFEVVGTIQKCLRARAQSILSSGQSKWLTELRTNLEVSKFLKIQSNILINNNHLNDTFFSSIYAVTIIEIAFCLL